MADPQKDSVAATSPAPHTPGDEVSTTDQQYSSRAAEPAPDGKDKVYYLKEGKVHHHIEKGELRTLDSFGDKATLSAEQYDAFKDKFHTDAEYKAAKAGRDTLDAAQAAEVVDTPEKATVEEAAAATTQASGEGAATQSSAGGKPEAAPVKP